MTFKNNTLIAVVGLSAIFGAMSPVVAQSPGLSSPNLPDAAINRPSQPIKGQYIVVFKDSVQDVEREVANLNRGQTMRVLHVYKDAIKGFAAQIPDVAVNGLRRNPNVDYIEQDMTVSVNAAGFKSPTIWGLARIDQSTLPRDDSFIFATSGAGVKAYIIDTGILSSHVDFGGRVLPGYTSIADGNGTRDCNGHGTHVAGTVGGTTWGVAKDVRLVPVRVLDCNGSGSWSGVIAGVNWVVSDHKSAERAVANMSLGGGFSSSVNRAVASGVSDGVVFAVAAGNDNANACNYSPASTTSAITVGATASSDARASYSNFGSCLDIFAPGSSITSAWPSSTSAINTISGTSMASPHVAGAAALLLETATDIRPSAITSALLSAASLNVVTSPGTNSPNRFLNVRASPVAPPRVTTTSATATSSSSANMSATLRTFGSGSSVTYGFCYSISASNSNPVVGGSNVTCTPVATNATSVVDPASYSLSVTGLTANTAYSVRSYATNSNGTTYGLIATFTTPL